MKTNEIPDILTTVSVAGLAKATKGVGLLGYKIRAISGERFCGRAVTALCPHGDNGALHMAIACAEPGNVIVGVTSGPLPIGMWGGISSLAARLRGITALVLDGYVTDLEEIKRSGFCVFARGSSPYPPVRKTKGCLNVPVLVEGVIVHPGDVIIGDEDGVIAIPSESLEEVIQGYRGQMAKEDNIIVRVKAGELTSNIFGVN